MEPVIRKRVTRVGSGAFSIYLPKKWIDAWLPDQQETRQVDLHRINDALLIVPAIQQQAYAAAVDPDPAAVRDRLLSAYVRGYRDVHLTPARGAFDTTTQVRARSLLRHTDERLVADLGPDAIGFRLDADLPAPFQSGADLLGVMAAKVREVLRLASEAVDTYGSDPERALHALRMLRSIHDEDVERLWHQALRLVATLELPLDTVSDFQVLDLLAAELHTMSSQCLHVAEAILREQGLAVPDLEYPLVHLLERRRDPGAMQPLARGIVRNLRSAFTHAGEALPRALHAVQAADTSSLRALAADARTAQEDLQRRLYENARDHWGERTPDGGERAMTANGITQPAGNLLDSLARLCRRAGVLVDARGGEP